MRRNFWSRRKRTASGYRLGILVRDHIAGIGTVTYYDPVSLQYGALGHGVSGLDGTQLLMLQSGYLVRASVAEVRTGTRGTPGELHGIFYVTDAVGTVEKIQPAAFSARSQPKPGGCQTAPASAVTTGAAEILSNVDGEQVQRFSIRIDRALTGREKRPESAHHGDGRGAAGEDRRHRTGHERQPDPAEREASGRGDARAGERPDDGVWRTDREYAGNGKIISARGQRPLAFLLGCDTMRAH